ncbi:hypothetical protein PENVUL_c005G09205 [Penicillium vulpinum]|uniref:Uncharacterized protein n=1 Tax=Penicillium vulpinum TaxID=29845 RepID=A0A1V6S7W1_9EURO|nr:hypothetical protein PENVUL_c005G09205 [Penicillium vulpinum]
MDRVFFVDARENDVSVASPFGNFPLTTLFIRPTASDLHQEGDYRDGMNNSKKPTPGRAQSSAHPPADDSLQNELYPAEQQTNRLWKSLMELLRTFTINIPNVACR